MLRLQGKRSRSGTSRTTRWRLVQDFKKLLTLFGPDDPNQVLFLWIESNITPVAQFLEEKKLLKQRVEKLEKLSKEECYDIQLRSGTSNEQWDIIKQSLADRGYPILYSSRSFNNIKQTERADMTTTLESSPMDGVDSGVSLNLEKVIRWLLTFFNHSQKKSSVWKLMIDGRPKCGKSEIVVGITPLSFSQQIQSSRLVFPVAIFSGKESEGTFAKFEKIVQDAMNIAEHGIAGHQIKWIHIADLKALWISLDLPRGSCPFCSCSSVADRSAKHGAGRYVTWSRVTTGILQSFSVKDLGICTLHMKLRFVDHFMFVLAACVRGYSTFESKLRQVMAELNLPFEYYSKKRGNGWRLPSWQGPQADVIIANVDKIAGCWPPVNLETRHDLKKRADLIQFVRANNLKPPTHPKNFRTITNKELLELIAMADDRIQVEFSLNETCSDLPPSSVLPDLPESQPHSQSNLDATPIPQTPNIPTENQTSKFVSLWSRLFQFLEFVDTGSCAVNDLEANWYTLADKWISDFKNLHQRGAMRIYEHILLAHGLDLYYRYGPLKHISNQGFEAANKRDVSYFHHHTSRNGGKIIGNKRQRTDATVESMLVAPYILTKHCRDIFTTDNQNIADVSISDRVSVRPEYTSDDGIDELAVEPVCNDDDESESDSDEVHEEENDYC